MRWSIVFTGLSVTFAGCGGPPPEYAFVGAVTACETVEWARTRAELLESGDTTEANRYASGRCFVVEPTRSVRIEESEGGVPGIAPRWVEVATLDGAPLEHLASAELRRTLGQPVRTRGWVRGRDVEPVP